MRVTWQNRRVPKPTPEAHAELGQFRETPRSKTELADRKAELSGAQAQTAQLKTAATAHEAKAREGQLEHLRETVHAQDEELVEVHTLKRQVEELQSKLGDA